jgi:hypothetical protein
MSFFSWLRNRTSPGPARARAQQRPAAPRSRPRLEALEDRCLPTTFYAATASDIVADIKAANLQSGTNTIVLTAPTSSPYVLTAADNTTDGGTILPVIAAGDNLTILTGNGSANPGYGDTIDAGKPINASKHGRLFDVASGASLMLENVTLQHGQVSWGTRTLQGGAIYNQGTLVLNTVSVLNNGAIAAGGFQTASGGGIWSNGALAVHNSLFQGNSAKGSLNAYGGAICIAGGTADISGTVFGQDTAQGGCQDQYSQAHGSGYGGAVYVAGGTVTMSADTLISNRTQGPGLSTTAAKGLGYGGGLYVAGGAVTLTNDTITHNVAGGWNGGGVAWSPPYGSFGYGGGIFIAAGANVSLDSFTLANTNSNTANKFPDIDGTYILLPGPQIGSFTASPNPVTAGSSLTLTASSVTDANPAATVTQVAFYFVETNTLLGYGTQTSPGVWRLTFTFTLNLVPWTYTLWAAAGDSSGVFSGPVALALTVQ